MKNFFHGKGKCSCIIPFYNEGERLLAVLTVVTKVVNIKQIICVDGGSKENLEFRIKNLKLFKNNPDKIIYLRLEKNVGKAAAMYTGVKKAKTEYIMFLDADLKNLQANELENAIKTVTKNPQIDMIILRRIYGRLESIWFRADTIFSGERILRKKDFLNV